MFSPHDNCDFNSYLGSLFYVANWPRDCTAVSTAELDSATFYLVLFFREAQTLFPGSSISLLYFLPYRHSIWLYRLLRSRERSRFKTQPDGHCWFLQSHSIRSELPISVLITFLFLILSFSPFFVYSPALLRFPHCPVVAFSLSLFPPSLLIFSFFHFALSLYWLFAISYSVEF